MTIQMCDMVEVYGFIGGVVVEIDAATDTYAVQEGNGTIWQAHISDVRLIEL